MRLFVDPLTGAGCSVVAGKPVSSPDELPDYAVEAHVFRRSESASAFVEALEIAANRNAFAWTWQPGSTEEGNLTVLLAKLSEPRPSGGTLAEAVRIVGHAAESHDAAVRAASERATFEEREKHVKARTRETGRLREMAAAAGMPVAGYALNWVRIGDATAERTQDGWRVTMPDGTEGGADADLCGAAAVGGVSHDPDEREFQAGPLAEEEEVLVALRAMAAARTKADELRFDRWREQAAAAVKMTASRRRFLAELDRLDGRAVIERRRGLTRIWAGDRSAGSSEMAAMRMAGWLRDEQDGRIVVTEPGRLAAGLDEAPENAAGVAR